MTAIPAASVILLRDDPLEVLMIRRHATSSFVPNAWVFPGGAVEPQDEQLGGDSIVNTMRYAAARELREETGIDSDVSSLVWTSRWITPTGVPKRFDTYFFLAKTNRDTVTKLQADEAVDSIWISPGDAVEKGVSGELLIVFPTLKNLEAIVGFRNANDLLESRRDAQIAPIQPIVVVENGERKFVIP